MYTEEQARSKWCPFSRTLDTDVHPLHGAVGASVNREPGDYDRHGNETVVTSGRHRCIASECMAWRFYTPKDWTDMSDPKKGFCGLSGAP